MTTCDPYADIYQCFYYIVMMDNTKLKDIEEFLITLLPTFEHEKIFRINTNDGLYHHVLYRDKSIKHGPAYISETTFEYYRYNYLVKKTIKFDNISRINKYYNGCQNFEMVTTNNHIFIAVVDTINNVEVTYVEAFIYNKGDRNLVMLCRKNVTNTIKIKDDHIGKFIDELYGGVNFVCKNGKLKFENSKKSIDNCCLNMLTFVLNNA